MIESDPSRIQERRDLLPSPKVKYIDGSTQKELLSPPIRIYEFATSLLLEHHGLAREQIGAINIKMTFNRQSRSKDSYWGVQGAIRSSTHWEPNVGINLSTVLYDLRGNSLPEDQMEGLVRSLNFRFYGELQRVLELEKEKRIKRRRKATLVSLGGIGVAGLDTWLTAKGGFDWDTIGILKSAGANLGVAAASVIIPGVIWGESIITNYAKETKDKGVVLMENNANMSLFYSSSEDLLRE